MKKVLIEVGAIELNAELNDSETAQAICNILPVSGLANVWGNEIYFSIPLHLDQASDAKQEVDVGDLGFWPVGDAFCIFFGPTPASSDAQPRAASPVNIFGHVLDDATQLKKISQGTKIYVSRSKGTG